MFVTPGSTTTRWYSRSTSRIRFIRDSTSSTPSSTGRAPPDRPEPAPRATHGTSRSWQARTTARTCSAVSGTTPAPGVAAYWSRPSDSYVRSWCGCVTTWSLPQIRCSSGMRVVALTPRMLSGHHPGQDACRLEVSQHAHREHQDQAPLEHNSEELALLAHHSDGRGPDRQVLRRDHLAEHSAGTVGRRQQRRRQVRLLRSRHLKGA